MKLTFSKNAKVPSTPHAWLASPGAARDTDRLVNNPPIELRRRMSRRSRTTVKLVGSVAETVSSPAWMFNAPTSNGPIFPVTRAPPTMGTTRPCSSPIFRL